MCAQRMASCRWCRQVKGTTSVNINAAFAMLWLQDVQNYFHRTAYQQSRRWKFPFLYSTPLTERCRSHKVGPMLLCIQQAFARLSFFIILIFCSFIMISQHTFANKVSKLDSGLSEVTRSDAHSMEAHIPRLWRVLSLSILWMNSISFTFTHWDEYKLLFVYSTFCDDNACFCYRKAVRVNMLSQVNRIFTQSFHKREKN